MLMAMVGLVLVVAAGNVANLFLARGEARSREIAIRFALGASRWRVLRALLMESQLLTVTAGALGLLLARWTTWLAPVVLNVERLPDGVTPAPDLRIGVAVIVVSLTAGFAIWAASALRAVGRVALTGLVAQIQAGVRQTLHWRRALVVAQAALSVVLLCGSAVLSRSLIRLMSVDPGFAADDLYSFWLQPDRSGYDSARSEPSWRRFSIYSGGSPELGAYRSLRTSLCPAEGSAPPYTGTKLRKRTRESPSTLISDAPARGTSRISGLRLWQAANSPETMHKAGK